MPIIIHMDMDAFFAACEEARNPRLRGLPIAVGSDPLEGRGRGVVSTANYAARAYGIRSATPISKAWQLSEEARRRGRPPVVFMDVRFELYGEISRRIRGCVHDAFKTIEQASVDEFYADATEYGPYEAVIEKCRELKRVIYEEEGLTASVGIAPNKLVAKMASEREKPNGLTVVRPEEVLDFLAPQEIRAIPGIGPKTEILLKKKNIRTIADLREFSGGELVDLLGKHGADLYEKARGRSSSPVKERDEAKSIGEQETFEHDTRDSIFVTERLRFLAGEVLRRMRHEGYEGFRTVVITVRFENFTTRTRSHTLPEQCSDPRTLSFEAAKLMFPFFDARENPRGMKIRLIGVRIEKLEGGPGCRGSRQGRML